jgi:hypothetical protein
MVKPDDSRRKRLHLLRVLPLLLCWVVLLAGLEFAVRHILDISRDSRWESLLSGLFGGGGAVLFIAIIGWLVQKGRLQWLVKD